MHQQESHNRQLTLECQEMRQQMQGMHAASQPKRANQPMSMIARLVAASRPTYMSQMVEQQVVPPKETEECISAKINRIVAYSAECQASRARHKAASQQDRRWPN